MSTQRVDQLARLAANAEPPALDESAARRLVDSALLQAQITPTDRRARSTSDAGHSSVAGRGSRAMSWAAGAAALAVAAAVALIVLRSPAEPALTHIALPTGDALTGTAGARFSIAELTPASRKLRLDAGAMVFDVAHVVAGQHFEVAAGDVTVVATGTVFSVSADPVRVHVYEGSVEVRRAARVERLSAGASYGSGADPGTLKDAGESAAHARAVRVAGAVGGAGNASRGPASAGGGLTSTVVTRVITVPVPFLIRVPATVPATAAVPATASVPVPAAVAATAPAAAPETPAKAADPVPVDANLVAARADVTAGRYTAALTKVAAAPHPLTGDWLLIDADALRAIGKKREAADALAAAVAVLDGSAQAEAGYSAAYLRFHDLHDSAGALAVLTAAYVDIPGSLFEERGLALHIQILIAAGKRAEAQPLAQRYLDRFPRGELRARMLPLARPQDATK